MYRTERLDEAMPKILAAVSVPRNILLLSLQIWRLWNRVFNGFASHANVAFDLHLYHCSLAARLAGC